MNDTGETGPDGEYRRRRQRHQDRREEAHRRGTRVRTARVLSFVAAVALLLAAEWTGGAARWLLYGAGGASVLSFGMLVVRHRGARREERWEALLADLNAEGRARLRRDWGALPEAGAGDPDREGGNGTASDLDLFGPASVRRLLSTVSTSPGDARIDRWLREPAPPREVERRQRAVESLSDRVDFRQRFAAHGRMAGDPDPRALERFLEWAGEDGWLEGRPWIHRAAWGLPALTWGLGAAHLAGWVGHAWWGLPLVATVLLAGRVTPEIHRIFDRAAAGEAELERYAELVELLVGLETGEALSGLTAPFSGREREAPRALRRLDALVHRSEARYGMLHLVLQVAVFWDVHVLRGLERWRDRSGEQVGEWLDALGRADALCGLAALAHDHPGWAFPELGVDAPPEIMARALGHPLLPPDDCVRNDVTVGPPGTFLLVTGSNMSGKSTLLRAVGVNVVLAQAGAPVCATRMHLPPTDVRTSIRVRDSVVEGVSLYMAELNRVRSVVEAARRAGRGEEGAEGTSTSPMLLYLLDEPLQGTNEAERREAVRIILRHLLDLGAVGAVATHDLRLHRTADLREAARPVHFRGEVRGEGESGPALTFDYRLREGPATSTNALDLLRLAGLGPPDA